MSSVPRFFMGNNKNKNQINFKDVFEKEKLQLQLEGAVDNSLWRTFDLKESKFLLKIIESKDLKIDHQKLNTPKFKAKKNLLKRFIELGLIHGFENPKKANHHFIFSDRLIPHLKTYINKLESKKKETKDWSRISFELIRNPNWKHQNTPLHSGTITFKQDIVIKAGTKCLYGVWARENKNLWLSITPVSDIIISKNRSVDYEPEPIRTILNRFLNE